MSAADASPAANTHHVWVVDIADATDDMLATASHCLDDAEQSRLAAMSHAGRRRQFCASRIVLRHALSTISPAPPGAWRFETSTLGRPDLAGDQQGVVGGFSLSHNDDAVAVAISPTGRIGVDLERRSRIDDMREVSRLFLSASEAARLAAIAPSAQHDALIRSWTVKEAYSKAVGRGLHLDFKTVDVLGVDDDMEPATMHRIAVGGEAVWRMDGTSSEGRLTVSGTVDRMDAQRVGWSWRVVTAAVGDDQVLSCVWEAGAASKLTVCHCTGLVSALSGPLSL